MGVEVEEHIILEANEFKNEAKFKATINTNNYYNGYLVYPVGFSEDT